MNNSLSSSGATAAVLRWAGRIVDDLDDGPEDLEIALHAGVCATICADSTPALVPSALALVERTRALAAGAFARPAGRSARAPREGSPSPQGILSRLGLISGSGEAVDALPARLGRTLLRQPAAVPDGLARIEAACRFGLRPIAAPRSLSRHLGAVLFGRLHDYDLTTAARVLRALLYLGDREEAALLVLGSRVLLAQQTDEGSFGFLGRECASLRRRLPGTRADLRFRLGVTTQVLWALAEIHGKNYRLVRDLGRGFDAARRAIGARETA